MDSNDPADPMDSALPADPMDMTLPTEKALSADNALKALAQDVDDSRLRARIMTPTLTHPHRCARPAVV
jgi:hypothetical protein